MTQTKEMTNPELNRALAELMGYYTAQLKHDVIALYKNGDKITGWWTHTEENAWSYAPDYCFDPAATLEVQKRALQVDEIRYTHIIILMTNGMSVDKYPQPFDHYGTDLIAPAFNATPRQIAEAAYMVLSQHTGR